MLNELKCLQQFKDKEEQINNKINEYGYLVKIGSSEEQVYSVSFKKIDIDNKYLPDIYYNANKNCMTIQTTSYGELSIDEYDSMVQQMKTAMNATYTVEKYFLRSDKMFED